MCDTQLLNVACFMKCCYVYSCNVFWGLINDQLEPHSNGVAWLA